MMSHSIDTTPAILGVQHTPPMADLPPLACDCHVHLSGDPSQYPMDSERHYTPRGASIEQLLAHQQALDFERVVIVQPSAYGINNRCMLNAIEQLGTIARGVAVINPDTVTDEELVRMHQIGIRGVRVNLESFGKSDPQLAALALNKAAKRIQHLGWHVQTYTNVSVISQLQDTIAQLPTPLVIDHFGKAMADNGVDHPGFLVLLTLLASNRVWIKLSGAHRVSKMPDCNDVQDLVVSMAQTNVDRLIWGSDWPHTGAWPGIALTPDVINEFHPIDDGHAANRIRKWLGNEAWQQKMLVQNPAVLYGFE